MILDLRVKLFCLGLCCIFYIMVSCLLTVTKMDARLLERRQDQTEFILSNHRHPTHSLTDILDNSETMRRRKAPKINWCKPLGLKTSPGPLVALASFPGSGNTWLRYLIQQATGILTGSVYRDYALLKNGFPAESISNGSVIAVKTHEYGSQARKDFDKAILLVRDPFSSVLAEFNRRWGGHIGHANNAKFRRENGKVWRDFVLTKGEAWETMNLDWALNFKGPRLVVFYWQLCKNTEEELKRILEFLEIQISDETLQCVMESKEGIYRRPKKPRSPDLFDPDLTNYLKLKQKKVFRTLRNPS